MQEVSEAYEVLSDDQKRSQYDGTTRRNPFEQQQHRDPFQGFSQRSSWQYKSNVDPEDLFRQIFGEFAKGFNQQRRTGGFSPFEDFSPFGFGANSQTTVSVSVQEAAKGVNKSVEVIQTSGDFRNPRVEKRRVSVPIPPGIEDGQTLRMSIGGNQEIFVTVRVENSGYFRREGVDVHTDATISLSQAILGGIIRIQGLYEDLNVRIPPGTSSHSVLTLSDRGFKRLDSYRGSGDHFVHLKIKIPVNLTEEQRSILTDYALTETDTPGTVTGLDKKGYSRTKRETKREETQETEPKEPVEEEGFLSKLKRKIFG